MKRKRYWGLVALIIIGLGIGTFLLLHKTDTDSIIIYKGDTEPTQKVIDKDDVHKDNSSVSDDVSASNIAESEKDATYATEPVYDVSEKGSHYIRHVPRDPSRFAHLSPPPLPPSAVPEDIPEHLIFLPEWMDGVYRDVEPPPPGGGLPDETLKRIANILLEIVREHNPKRPYAEIWDQFIENEKMYRAYAEWELGYTPVRALTAQRLDWIYEQTWAFPEFVELAISTTTPPVPHGEENPFSTAVDVAMGYMEPDWNKITLEDGRDFFIKGNTRYEFVYSGITEDGNEWERVTGFSRVRLTDSTPVVRIDVTNTSDADLKAMMGWDYTINPLTQQPLVHDSSYVNIYPRLMGAD